MGIVIKQTLKGAIYSYFGVILGGINVAILFPIIFSEAEVGLINVLVSISTICAQFSSLGAAGVINYFFPKFKDKTNAHHSFFIFISLFSAIGFALFTLIYIFYGEYFLLSKSADIYLQNQHEYLLYPLTFFTLGFILVDTLCASTLNTAIGFFYKEIILRVVILLLCILTYFQILDFSTFLIFYILNFAIPVFAVLVYLFKKNDVSFKMPEISTYKPYLTKIFSVGIFFIFTGLSNSMATYIDKFMINYFLGLKSTGIYSITNYFGALARIPRSSMGKIATPLIAQALKDNDQKKLSYFFEKASISQVLFGVLVFILIWGNIDQILNVLPASYSQGKWVVFFISISHITHCFLGVGGLIVQVSSYYKYPSYFNIALGLMVVVFNYFFIPIWGIAGAAAATLIAKSIFIVGYLLFLNRTFLFKVLFLSHLKIFISGFMAYIAVYCIVDSTVFNIRYLDSAIIITYRSILMLLTFILMLYFTGMIKNLKGLKKMF